MDPIIRTYIDILKGLLTPLIGLIAAYIAYQQYKTNKQREIRESREGRLAVYRRVKKFLNYVDSTRDISEEFYTELAEAVAEADFLYPEELDASDKRIWEFSRF